MENEEEEKGEITNARQHASNSGCCLSLRVAVFNYQTLNHILRVGGMACQEGKFLKVGINSRITLACLPTRIEMAKQKKPELGIKNKALHYRLWAKLEEALKKRRPPRELAEIKRKILSNTYGEKSETH